jgi:hypothetical protein
MAVITILSHGTANSTNRETSSGHELVISKISRLLFGEEGVDWILNEGAGTAELRHQHGISGNWFEKKSRDMMGIAAGEGVEANVATACRFVRDRLNDTRALTVNLAGHSRGSITCYKIANQLLQTYGNNVPVNIFAIDPVPGNNGRINAEMYSHIALGPNVSHSFLMLAESEHRLNFRPYVDEVYLGTSREHKFDTIPGTHGGINELGGSESEAADLVLSRALRFLKKNGSFLKSEADRLILDDAGALRQYSSLMMRLSEYKCNASVNPFKGGIDGLKNLAMSTLNVDKHRVVNVARGTPVDDRGRADHHGLGMSQALGSMGVFEPHAQRPVRFFANKEHEKLFEKRYPTIKHAIRNLEGSGSQQNVKALRDAVIANANAFTMMDWMTQTYFSVYCERAKVLA